jgi:hypothetical protein
MITVPNFALLDASQPDIARLVQAMIQAREAVDRRSWSHPQGPTKSKVTSLRLNITALDCPTQEARTSDCDIVGPNSFQAKANLNIASRAPTNRTGVLRAKASLPTRKGNTWQGCAFRRS